MTAAHCHWAGVVVSALVSINEVHRRLARLVLGWLTVSGVQLPVSENLSHCITSHSGQLTLAIPTWVGDALWLGNEGRYAS